MSESRRGRHAEARAQLLLFQRSRRQKINITEIKGNRVKIGSGQIGQDLTI